MVGDEVAQGVGRLRGDAAVWLIVAATDRDGPDDPRS